MGRYSVSQYLPIWNKLKTDRKVSVVIPQPLHARLIKAVIKRKDEDLGYKLMLGEESKKAKLSYTIEENIIHFKLKIYINGIGEL